MPRFVFRLLLKLLHWTRRAACANTGLVKRAFGFNAVAQLLESIDGADAVAVLRAEGGCVGASVRIQRGPALINAEHGFEHLSIGDHCHLGRQLMLDLAAPITIGNRATISMRSTVLTHTDVGDSRCGIAPFRAAVVIEDDAYVGAGATLLPGIRIGAGAVVASGALVTRDVAPRTIVAGVPARPLTEQRKAPTPGPAATRTANHG